MKSITLTNKDIERFWSKVDRSGKNECWNWKAHLNNKGYGVLGVGRELMLAHRISWTIENGEIPAGMEILHRCDNPCCVNPNHLISGTHHENILDMLRKGRYKKSFIFRGESHTEAKLRNEDIPEIRRLFDQGIPTRTIAKKYNVDSKTIWSVGKRISWTHIK